MKPYLTNIIIVSTTGLLLLVCFLINRQWKRTHPKEEHFPFLVCISLVLAVALIVSELSNIYFLHTDTVFFKHMYWPDQIEVLSIGNPETKAMEIVFTQYFAQDEPLGYSQPYQMQADDLCFTYYMSNEPYSSSRPGFVAFVENKGVEEITWSEVYCQWASPWQEKTGRIIHIDESEAGIILFGSYGTLTNEISLNLCYEKTGGKLHFQQFTIQLDQSNKDFLKMM